MSGEARGQPDGAEVELRRMTVRHLGGVLAVERATSSPAWAPATFTRELQDPATRRYVVACVPSRRWPPAGRVIGFAGVQARPDAAHVTTIAVAPEHRRRGVGARLLGWLLQAAAELGQAALTLEVRAGNDPARRLYARAGFVDAGVRPGYYRHPREDAVIMWRWLDTAPGASPAAAPRQRVSAQDGR